MSHGSCFWKWIGLVLATVAAPVFAGVMVMPDTTDVAAARAESIVVADVVEFKMERTMLPDDPANRAGPDGPQFRRQRCVNTYQLVVTDVKKGGVKVSPEKMTVRFEWILVIPVDPNMFVSQALPGSGMESDARKGKWVFFLGPDPGDGKAREVLRIEALGAPES